MDINNNRLQDEAVGRLMVRMSFPAITGMILYSLFALIDTFFVARLGTAALAALTLCVPIEILLVSVGSATGVGITSLLSRTLGEKDLRYADNIAWHGLIICIIYGLFFSWIGINYIDWLLHAFGCTPAIYDLSRDYLSIVLLGCLFTFVPMMAGHIVQGEGNALLPMLVAVLGIILNVLLDPVLIFGWGPVEGMGMRGAAWATVGAQIGCTLLALFTMFRKPNFLSWSVRNFRPSMKVMAGIYKVGIPSLMMELLSVAIMIVFNRILLSFGPATVAVVGIFVRVRSLFYMPVFGLSQGLVPIAGFAFGACNYDRVKESIIKAAVFSVIFVSIGWIFMQYHAEWLMRYFSQDESLIAAGVNCMRLATLFLPVMGPIIILSSSLQALGQGMTAMWLSVIRQIGFFLPALLVLPLLYGLNGVWLAFSISEFLSGLLALFFLTRMWKVLQTQPKSNIFIFDFGYILRRMGIWLKW